ncbi:SGNH/GDSL hydrolase family protein [Bosea sp. BH3]|uniref:SGNH/GDSL hydrolase family protein n=1 Tax=Bosea sp. BH3 TaxID=2871701 RepID=UPI0021CB9097|nr:SGNH/GDSL hydrolase family protein [Bosea sp. BH3]MCU4179337.1 SGNH/GDSL hydrolase family protein [Bosea sp. BH3]
MRLLVSSLVAATLLACSAQAAPFECRPATMTAAEANSPVPAGKIAQDHQLKILAIGSSSTEGVGASSKDKTYPERLRVLLEQAWPKTKVEMVNAGIGGETAPQTFQRLRQLMAEGKFDLVIWQVGTNDAVTGGNMDVFKELIREGIDIVRGAGAGLVILDQQFYPGIKDPQRYGTYVAAVAETARERSVPVLSRYAAMTGWYKRDAAAFASVLAGDSFHMSDAGYDCLARGMAMSFAAMTAKGQPVASAGR